MCLQPHTLTFLGHGVSVGAWKHCASISGFPPSQTLPISLCEHTCNLLPAAFDLLSLRLWEETLQSETSCLQDLTGFAYARGGEIHTVHAPIECSSLSCFSGWLELQLPVRFPALKRKSRQKNWRKVGSQISSGSRPALCRKVPRLWN